MTTIEQALPAFFASAEAIIDDGLAHARADDPHRFATLGKEFDGGRALRQLRVDYLPENRMRIALVFVGTRESKAHEVEVFGTTVQGETAGGVR
ncbi:hypothetical protein ACWKW4_08085 [Hydrogenophaga borbori]